MTIEFSLTEQCCNTGYAGLAAICAHYQQQGVLKPLEQVENGRKEQDFLLCDKLSRYY